MERVVKLLAFAAAFLFLCTAVPAPTSAADAPVSIAGETAVLMDADTGQILFEKGMDATMAPASVTKILTALLAVERGNLDDVLTASSTVPTSGSRINLVVGEQITLRDALYSLMLFSANDAANLIAEHIGGSQAGFAQLMNERAAEIGVTGTHFTNAWGQDDSDEVSGWGSDNNGHYSTARDMALITRAAMQNETVLQVMGTATHTVAATNVDDAFLLTNGHSMVNPASPYFDSSVLGGKIGYWPPENYTISTVAKRGDRTLICVVFATGVNTRYTDTQTLFYYGFTGFKQVQLGAEQFSSHTVPITRAGVTLGEIELFMDEPITLLIPNDVDESSLQIQYQVPNTIDLSEGYTAAIEIVLPDGTAALPTYSLALKADHGNLETLYTETEDNASAGPIWIGGLLFFLFVVVFEVWRRRRVARARANARRRAHRRAPQHLQRIR